MSQRPDILLVSTADWDNPYWTNKQHMALQFARRGHRVFYVESQGLRAPTATTKDLRRMWTRLRRGLGSPKQVMPNLYVFAPLVIPFHRSLVVRRVNRAILKMSMDFWCRVNRLKPRILWTYSPMSAELYDLSDYELVVYHAVDDVKAQPGVPRAAIEAGEEALSRAADIVFTTAPNLPDWHAQRNPNTHYFPNVADYDHFNSAMSLETRIPPDIASIAGPRIGFIGAISSYKLDFQLVRSVAQNRPDWSFVFVGEIGEGDPLTDPSMLTNVSNIHFLGGRPYATLPGYLKGMDVAILPSLINEYTRSMFPMKFFEYLAAGKPVVSTELPALSNYRGVAEFCADAEGFEVAIGRALRSGGVGLDKRLEAAREQTYDIRTEKMWAEIQSLLAKRQSVASRQSA